jgi:hypothetical protein
MHYTVELSDVDGKAVRVRLTLPLRPTRPTVDNSTWHVLDEGMIKFRSGGCLEGEVIVIGGPSQRALNLSRGANDASIDIGVQLFDFQNAKGEIRGAGNGSIVQSWVVALKEGDLTWAVID